MYVTVPHFETDSKTEEDNDINQKGMCAWVYGLTNLTDPVNKKSSVEWELSNLPIKAHKQYHSATQIHIKTSYELLGYLIPSKYSFENSEKRVLK